MSENALTVESKTHLRGLKLWSTNALYMKSALTLYEEGIFDYVELQVVPGKGEDSLNQWKQIPFPLSLHAPHYAMGLNFSLGTCEEKNRDAIKEVDDFRKQLNPAYVVFHPGAQGTLEETIRQIKLFKSEFKYLFNIVLIENKPKMGLKDEICVGASVEEIKTILEETGLGFCMDVGHAICYSAWKQAAYIDILDQFLALNPQVFHLTDGDINSVKDRHDHFGEGNFDLAQILKMIPKGARITVETKKDSKDNLDDFRKDILYLGALNNE